VAILTMAGNVHNELVNLHDAAWIKVWLPQLAEQIGMHPVGEAHVELYPHWRDLGGEGAPSVVLFVEDVREVTAFLHLQESSLTIHTYPEKRFIGITLDSCNPIPGEGIPVSGEIARILGLELKFWAYEPAMDWRVLADGPAHQPTKWPAAIRALAA
jgi:S-adenosylmethionine/arginine decarboxylase-like enzyme